MKRIGMIVLMVVAATALAFAQTGGPKGGQQGGQNKGGQQGQKGGGQGGRGFGGGGFRMMQDPKMAAKMKEIQAAAAKKAGLSAAQIKQVDEANQKQMKSMQSFMPKPGGNPPSEKDRDALRSKMQQVRKDHEAALTKIMGAAKLKIYQTALREGFQKAFPRPEGRGPGGPGGNPPAGNKGSGKGTGKGGGL